MVTYGFFDSIDGDRKYNADDISNYFLKLISNGVFATPANAMQVQESSGMTVKVSAGWGFINCKWINNDSDYFITLDEPDIILNRADRIVLRLNKDESLRNIEIAVKRGTPGENPSVPSLQRDESVWELSLAYVMVWAGRTEITQADIADERGNTEVCGWVTGLINQIDTTNLFAQYDSAFWLWFNTIKDDIVPNATLVRQYQVQYVTTLANESVIPVNSSWYNPVLDVLNVYVNGFRLAPGTDFTVNVSSSGFHTVTLAKALDVVGTPVDFEILKSLYSEDTETVMTVMTRILNQTERLVQNCYYCNGVNDNQTLPAFIATWKAEHPKATVLKVIGEFGVNDTVSRYMGTAYSMIYRNEDSSPVTLDFSDCDVISAQNNSFAYFSGCHIKNLTLTYSDLTSTGDTVALKIISGSNCEIENSHISGDFSGTSATSVSCYDVSNSRLIHCKADFSSENALWGIRASSSFISDCDIKVTGLASETVCGVSALTSNGISSCFEAVGTIAYGGQSGGNSGNYSECTFIGKGSESGYGFYVNNTLNASDCSFRGYTQDSENYVGYGISGNSAAKVFLHGITCPEINVSGYSQTGSMVFDSGQGFYTGSFYVSPVLPEAATILTYTDFSPTSILTQAQYDAIASPAANVLYIITGE